MQKEMEQNSYLDGTVHVNNQLNSSLCPLLSYYDYASSFYLSFGISTSKDIALTASRERFPLFSFYSAETFGALLWQKIYLAVLNTENQKISKSF